MSKETFVLNAKRRDDQGKGASRRLRHEGRIPAIVYGGGTAPEAITIEHNEIIKHLEHESFYSHVLELNVDGATSHVILRDLHRHPFKPSVMHADFQRVSSNETLHMTVPLHFLNKDTCVGAKAGGLVHIALTEIHIECPAHALPEYVSVDLKDLDIHQSLHLSQITLPAGVKITALIQGAEHDAAVVSIHPSKLDKTIEPEA